MKVIVNQPTYIPWMGYFAMIDLADVFVFYDDVQFSVQSWQQSNRIKTAQGIQKLTVPIERHFGQKINEVKINSFYTWGAKHWKSIGQSYSKAPYFEQYESYIRDTYEVGWYYLCDLNIYLIRLLTELLDVRIPKFVKSSERKLSGAKTDRLIPLLQELGATEYISGLAAKDYIGEDKFKEADIKLTWFNYQHPAYPQIRGEFISHLSAIDLLFNTGAEAINYIRRGYV